MTSSSQYVGLFGYSEGLTFFNVVIGDSSSIESTFSSNGAYVGGVIGHCQTYVGPCRIENSVNMASVTFAGDSGKRDLRIPA